MSNADQLARIAAARPPEPADAVSVYKLHHGVDVWDVWIWLCVPCLGVRLGKGWAQLEKRKPEFAVPCQDCEWKKGHP